MKWVLAVAAVAALLAGCGEDDLGACDMVLLEATAGMNQPYVGQSVMQGCTACHSATKSGAARVGAPAGLDFDVVPFDGTPTQLALVERGAAKVRELKGEIWEEVEEGAMPPSPPAGLGELASGDKQTLRNWLACNAPIHVQAGVQSTGDPWTDIYGQLMGVNGGFGPCTVCHSSAGGTTSGGGFTMGDDACTAYARVVNGPASATACGPTGGFLVVPGNPAASLLSQKLGASPSCGEIMPYGTSMPFSATNPGLTVMLDQWISSGAPKPLSCP